jgi:hypothetical protein
MMNDKDVKEYHKMVDKLNKQQKELDASYKQSLANKQERMTNVKGLKKINILSLDCDWITNPRQQEDLLVFMIPIIYNHTDIVTTYSHSEIYPLFTHGYDEYNLINIDHHHDFHYGYVGKDKTVLDEGNWLFHLSNIFKKKINYTWISNPDSSHIFLKEYKNLKSFSFDHNLDYIKERKFDKIFICCSPDYASNPGVISTYKIIEKIVKDRKERDDKEES